MPVAGEDERFHNGFTIRAEKCPNRRGVEEVIAHFMGRVPTQEDLLAEVAAGERRGVWVSGGYKSPWIDDDTAARFDGLEILVVQDMFSSPLWLRATYQLPGAAFAEREGSYVNRADRLQTALWAIRPPAGVRVEGEFIGDCWGSRDCTKPAGCWTKSPPRFAIFPLPPIRCRRSASI